MLLECLIRNASCFLISVHCSKGYAVISLVNRLIEARGEAPVDSIAPLFADKQKHKFLPEKGDVVHVRNRQYLVDGVTTAGDVEDPRGGVRYVIPEKAKYWEE